jgi:hypothetical protein
MWGDNRPIAKFFLPDWMSKACANRRPVISGKPFLLRKMLFFNILQDV